MGVERGLGVVATGEDNRTLVYTDFSWWRVLEAYRI